MLTSVMSDVCRLVLVIMVLSRSMYRVTLIKFHEVDSVSVVRLSVLRIVSIKFDLLGSLGLPSVKFDL
jgi:hypothetical protein